MSNEEAQKILDSMHSVNPENLQGEAKKLFEAIMKIADERDSLRKTVERQNLEIMAQKIEEQHENVELETKLEEKDKTINAMAEYIASRDIDEDICKYINCGEGDKEREECVECVIDFFEEF